MGDGGRGIKDGRWLVVGVLGDEGWVMCYGWL